MKLFKKVYDIPNSFLEKENKPLEIIIKVFSLKENSVKECDNEKQINTVVKELYNIVEKYIKKAKINSTVSGLYNELFENFNYFFTFKPRAKENLASNNIHIQIIL